MATLRRCLQSVTPLVNELIVVDTGSSDGSPELAQSLGAKVVRVSWQENFSAARNQYLAMAKCSWILSLDSDEFIETLDRSSFQKFLGGHPNIAFAFAIRSYFLMEDLPHTVMPSQFAGEVAPGIGCAITRTVRLFPNRPSIRYSYPVHESLRPALSRQAIPLRMCRVPIHHVGYLQGHDQLARKSKQYRELGEKKIHQFPRYFLGYLELGKVLLNSGELEAAERLFANCIRLNPNCADGYYCLGLALLRQGRHSECRTFLRRALSRFPGPRTQLDCLLGVLELESGNQLEAVRKFSRILRKGCTVPFDYIPPEISSWARAFSCSSSDEA